MSITKIPQKGWMIMYYLLNSGRHYSLKELKHWFGGDVSSMRLIDKMQRLKLITEMDGKFYVCEEVPEEAKVYIECLRKT